MPQAEDKSIYISSDCLQNLTMNDARRMAQTLFDMDVGADIIILNSKERIRERYTRAGAFYDD